MVGTFSQTDFENDTGTQYKTKIDGNFAVLAAWGGSFACHEQDTPNMTVRIDAGILVDGTTVLSVAAQNSATITAPVSNSRIDLIVLDTLGSPSGSVAVVTGTAAASPVRPAIGAGQIPLCAVLLTSATTSIANTDITDLRGWMSAGSSLSPTGDGSGLSGVLKTGYHAFNRPAPSWKPQTTNGAAALAWYETSTYHVMVPYLSFADGGGSPGDPQYAQSFIDLPPSADGSAMIAGMIKWFETTGGSPNEAKWQIEMQAQGDGDALDSPWGAPTTLVDAGGSGIFRYAAFAAALPAGSPGNTGERLYFRITRLFNDASDTLAGPALFAGMQGYMKIASGTDA